MPATLLALVASLLVQTPPTAPPPAAAPPPVVKPYVVNVRIVEELRLPDLEGKEHVLFEEFKDKALVFVFWSFKDPVSRFYAPHLAELQKLHADRLAIVLIDSNHDELVGGNDPLLRLKEVVAAEKVTLPLLVDRENRLADDFNATANGQVFLVDANHFVRYMGGIDDDPKGERRAQGIERRAWLEDALASVLKGERPSHDHTRPAGRPIKRAPRGGVPSEGALPDPKKPK